MKQLIVFLTVFSLFFHSFSIIASSAELSVSAQSCVVMVADTGEVVYEKNAYTQRGMASTTKIMTSIIALESGNLTRNIIPTKEQVSVEGTSIGLKPGDKIDLLTLVKGMLLESGNDAANVTACLIAGSKEEFSVLMNEKAKSLGMNSTSFKNPSGLPEENHYSCAYDMALLGSYCIKNTVFKSICSEKKLTVTFGEPQKTVTFYNHNKLLSKYEGALGIKTGFTKASGRCLVSAVERDGVTLVCVTLNAYDDWNDHIKLYDYSFSRINKVEISENTLTHGVHVVGEGEKWVYAKPCREVFIPFYKNKPQVKVKLYLPHFVYSGVEKGEYLGWAEIYSQDNTLLKTVFLVSSKRV